MFSDSPATTTQPVVEALDPYGYAMYKLYRESTRLVGGKRVKDLNSLNRDLGKVVCVDVNPEMYRLQPENGISLKKWTGEKKDQELDRMMTFLEEIALFMTIANSTDMRPLLKLMRTINSDDLPAAWEIHKNKMRQKFANDYGAQPIKTGLFGRKNVSPQSMTVFDIIERAAREERAYFEKEKVENIAHMQKMRKEAEEEHKKQIEGLKAKKMKMLDYLFLSQQKPEDQAKY